MQLQQHKQVADMGKKRKTEDFGATLHESFDHWEQTYKNGCHDPFYPDGVNLNLIRNHIIYYKRQIEEFYPPDEYPQIYYRETPPEVDQNYIARMDEIKSNAINALKVYQEDADYLYLKRNVNRLTKEEQKRLCIGAVLGYVERLTHHISSGDFVSMRRHEDPDRYRDNLVRCANEVRQLNRIEERQEIISYVQCSMF